MEVADPYTREALGDRGYLDRVPAPAVYWVNTTCAAAAVGLVHGIAAAFIDPIPGIDWIFDLVQGNRLGVVHDPTGCFFRSPDGLFASAGN